MDLDDPEQRRNRLERISRQTAKANHDWLRRCFEAELAYRLAEPAGDYFENIYHCAVLLHIVGDLHDLALFYQAKRGAGDFDLGCGFDWEFLFMASPAELQTHAAGLGRDDIRAWIEDYASSYDPEALGEWLELKIEYYGIRD